jgi:hypothetical protein
MSIIPNLPSEIQHIIMYKSLMQMLNSEHEYNCMSTKFVNMVCSLACVHKESEKLFSSSSGTTNIFLIVLLGGKNVSPEESMLISLKRMYIALRNGYKFEYNKKNFDTILPSCVKDYLFVTQYDKNNDIFDIYMNNSIPCFDGQFDERIIKLCHGSTDCENELISKYYLSNDALMYHIKEINDGYDAQMCYIKKINDGDGAQMCYIKKCNIGDCNEDSFEYDNDDELFKFVTFLVDNVINPNNYVKYDHIVIDNLVKLLIKTIDELFCVKNVNKGKWRLQELKNKIISLA